MILSRSFAAAGVAAIALAGVAGAPASTPSVAFDDEDQRECSVIDWAAPAAIAADHLFGEQLRLRIHVLVDAPRAARKLIQDATQETYVDGVRVDVSFTWGSVNLPSGEVSTEAAFAAAKSATGGRPPRGADLVYLVTDADLVSGTTGNAVAGQADCIGGIMHPSRAYAVGEFDEDDLEDRDILGAGYFKNMTGKIFAHEIGHLLGAHHHYANCAEGVPSDPVDDVLSTCTLMFNDVGLVSLNFSSFNSAVTRGHVGTYGNDNQG